MASTQRNIEVDSEVWDRLKGEATRRNKNVRGLVGEILSDYTKGACKRSAKGVKAIILAAGMSSRLMELTDDKPKCMIEIGGKTLLQRQIEIFKQCGIEDIVIVRGYKKEKINYTDVKYVYNKNYRRNNILESLMHAKSELGGEFIVTYSDILFKRDVVERLLKSGGDIAAIVDSEWIRAYEGRSQHPVEEAENVVIQDGRVVKIGKIINPNEAHGEFIGMAKFTAKGADILKSVYNDLKTKLGDSLPFQAAQSLEKAYLTDMLQEMIDRKNLVTPVMINGGWMELDTIEDFQRAGKAIGSNGVFAG